MKKALLVGINNYPDPQNNLRGCINDITDMANYLVSQKQFNMQDIRLLSDNRATKANIVERLNWLITDVKPGDQILFHYSGHGAQMASRAGSGEVDKLDEVICPYDFDFTDATTIKDKEFNQLFSAIPNGVEFIWVSDSCHSADLSKGFKKPTDNRNKSMLAPIDIAWRNKTASNSSLALKTLYKASNTPNLALISGCKSNQESADAVFDQRFNGALTYYLLQTLHAAGGSSLSLKKLVANINNSLKKAQYEQRPQIEGSASIIAKPFF